MSHDRNDYTDEEKVAMREAIEQFRSQAAPPEHADRIQRCIYARALYHYALAKMSAAAEAEQRGVAGAELEQVRNDGLVRATAALNKAHLLYPMPLYLYDLAGLREVANDLSGAVALYERFIREQKGFRADQIDRALLLERDVEAALRDSVSRMEVLRGHLGLLPPNKGRPWWKLW